MDYLAHGLWSYILFHKTRKPMYAVMFGLLPDTSSWFIYAVYSLFKFESFGKPALQQVPDWVFSLYNVSHSLVIAAAIFLGVFICLRKIPVYMYAWPIAIVIDLLTHSREFLPTPFLWPVSVWKFPGISWGSTAFVIANYTAIAICLAYIFWKKKKAKK